MPQCAILNIGKLDIHIDLRRLQEMRKFYDTETGNIISEDELLTEWVTLYATGETDCNTFLTYVRECTSKNGTLEEIR